MTASLDPQQIICDELMDSYTQLIYRTSGIRIPAQKKTLMSNRIRRRLRELKLPDFRAYFQLLQKLNPGDREWDLFLQEITTHETYLYRDQPHWDWFQNEFLPQIAEENRVGRRPRSLRIWSAACSTGDEPFTLASCLASSLPNYLNWNIRIVATDIGIGALQQAKEATFDRRAMKLVPEKARKEFFVAAQDGLTWKAKPVLRNMIQFRQHNLLEPLNEPSFDLVVLKNVLIYFDQASKRAVLTNIRKALRPGAILLAGAAEGVAELLKDCERRQPWLYRTPTKS